MEVVFNESISMVFSKYICLCIYLFICLTGMVVGVRDWKEGKAFVLSFRISLLCVHMGRKRRCEYGELE